MENNLVLVPKSFWKRPEGPFGVGLLVLIAGGVLTSPIWIPKLLFLLASVYVAGAAFAGLVLFGILLMNGTVTIGFKLLARAIARLFVTVDAVGIAYERIDSLKEKRAAMAEDIKAFQTQMRGLQATIQGKVSEMQSFAKLGSAAKKANNISQAKVQATKIARREKSVRSLGEMYQKMETIFRALKKAYENSGYTIDNLEDEVDEAVSMYEASLAALPAMQRAKDILGEEGNRTLLFELSMEHMADKVDEMWGEMDNLMFITEEVNASIDLEKGMFAEEGFALIDKWEADSKSGLLLATPDKDELLALARNPASELDLDLDFLQEKI
jgi:hypothetical protein